MYNCNIYVMYLHTIPRLFQILLLKILESSIQLLLIHVTFKHKSIQILFFVNNIIEHFKLSVTVKLIGIFQHISTYVMLILDNYT